MAGPTLSIIFYNTSKEGSLMNKTIFFFMAFIFLSFYVKSQDIGYARANIKILASEKMHGRGYVKNGDRKAAKFIKHEFRKMGLKQFDGSYFQPFEMAINTFPKTVKLSIQGKELSPGRDFVVYSSSPSLSGKFEVLQLPEKFKDADAATIKAFFLTRDLKDKFLLIDKKTKKSVLNILPDDLAGVLFYTDKKLIWSVHDGRKVGKLVLFEINTQIPIEDIKEIEINIKNNYCEQYKTQNVLGYVPGKKHPEKFIFFTAHYDHLGRMGKSVYFPGANDNASGTAMIMDLAKHYSLPENQADCSIGFIAFAGEEAGLVGSNYFVLYPQLDLDSIQLLVNLDMVGTGSEGITIVNGKVMPELFDKISELNKENGFLRNVKARGESCNSDHCPFYQKGVPAVFIYTRGKEFMEYHNPDDISQNLPLTEYEDLFRLLVETVKTF
jgi:aminopeptidase YwaD